MAQSWYREETDYDGNKRLVWKENKKTKNTLYMMRTILGFSVEEVAKELNLSVEKLKKYECGMEEIDEQDIANILDKFQVNLQTLFPTLNSYDGGKTYLPMELHGIHFKRDLHFFTEYYESDTYSSQFNLLPLPVKRYDKMGHVLNKVDVEDMSIDEFYNFSPMSLTEVVLDDNLDYRFLVRNYPTKDLKLPRNYQIIEKFCHFKGATCDEEAFGIMTCHVFNAEAGYRIPKKVDVWNKEDSFKNFDYVESYSIKMIDETIYLILKFKNGDTGTINLSNYYDSDSEWYKHLKNISYVNQVKLVFLFGENPENQYLTFPDGQIIALAEHQYEWFKNYRVGYTNYNKCNMLPVFEKRV